MVPSAPRRTACKSRPVQMPWVRRTSPAQGGQCSHGCTLRLQQGHMSCARAPQNRRPTCSRRHVHGGRSAGMHRAPSAWAPSGMELRLACAAHDYRPASVMCAVSLPLCTVWCDSHRPREVVRIMLRSHDAPKQWPGRGPAYGLRAIVVGSLGRRQADDSGRVADAAVLPCFRGAGLRVLDETTVEAE